MTDHGAGSTLSMVTGGRKPESTGLVPHLFLVAQAGQHREAPLRLRLDEIDEVILSRASHRRVEASEDGGRRLLRLGVADSWMSLDHATLTRGSLCWRVVDRGSKNGTKVNGSRQPAAMLGDGDLLELGHTFFVFRSQLPSLSNAPRWLDARRLAPLLGLATLSPGLAERFDELARLAASKTSIVIRGPSGSGKELLARAVHTLSGRRGPFVAVNCAGLPESLVESELFGYTRGAFSGAVRDHDGLVGASANGTLFLDEIGDLPRTVQSKLLRALQEQAVRPLGATTETQVDLRVVAATHRDLGQLVEAGAFRDDLLGRLGGSFELPPLCERREDIGLIIDALRGRIEDPRASGAELSCTALRAILSYSWPRNIRELQKALERAIALAGTEPIERCHLPPELQGPLASTAPRPSESPELSEHDRIQRVRLIELLRAHRGNIAAVAREMRTVRSQVQRWMKRYGVDRNEPDDEPGGRLAGA